MRLYRLTNGSHFTLSLGRRDFSETLDRHCRHFRHRKKNNLSDAKTTSRCLFISFRINHIKNVISKPFIREPIRTHRKLIIITFDNIVVCLKQPNRSLLISLQNPCYFQSLFSPLLNIFGSNSCAFPNIFIARYLCRHVRLAPSEIRVDLF